MERHRESSRNQGVCIEISYKLGLFLSKKRAPTVLLLRDVMINSGYKKHRLGNFLSRFRENPYYTSRNRLIFAAEIRKMTELTMILESDGFLENGSLTYKIR